jgi:large subunit ribosomal protein L10
MPKTRGQKEQAMQALTDAVKQSKSVVFANFQGLKVSESEELRRLCRKEGIEYLAAKKTLVAKALKDAGIEGNPKSFVGAVSVVFGTLDEVAPAQILANFAKTHEAVKLFGGILEGAFIDGAKVAELSKLPSKQQLLQRLVGTLNAPISGFVNVLAGNLRGLVTVLDAIKATKV